jgi:hypothetical protein
MLSNVVLWGTGLVGVTACALYLFQDYLLYFPTIHNSRNQLDKPSGSLANVFEDHFLRTPDGVTVNLWLFRQPSQGRPTILFFHGNAGSKSVGLWLVSSSLRREISDTGCLIYVSCTFAWASMLRS